MLTMPRAVRHVKDYFTTYLPDTLVLDACAEAGHHWRERHLGPVVTTYLFLKQVLHHNTACTHLRHLAGMPVNPSAYCQARARLPLAFFEALQQRALGAVRTNLPAASRRRWAGHRLFFLDGSAFSMPDTAALQAHFGQPSGQAAGCGFPVAHLMLLFDYPTGMLRRTLALPLRSHDSAHAAALHPALRAGDVLVGDRAFGNYAHLALCRRRGLHGLFRVHQKQIVSFRPHRRHQTAARPERGLPTSRWVARLGHHDQLVEYVKPAERPEWMSEEEWQRLPATLLVREVRHRVRVPGVRTKVVTLVTTLLDAERYPAKELARLYGLRWGGGDQSEAPEADPGHGRAALQEGGRRPQGIDPLRDPVQPGAPRHGRRGGPPARRGGPGQLHRRLALAAAGAAGRRPARPGGESEAPGPLRAPRAQTPPQAVPRDDPAARPTAPPGPAQTCESLIARHS